MLRHRDSLWGIILGLLLLWAPLPFGSVTPSARILLAFGVGLSATVFSFRQSTPSRYPLKPILAFLACTLCGFRGGTSWDDVILWGTVALAFLLGSMATHSQRSRQFVLISLALSGLFQVLYGTSHWFARSTTIWGQAVPNAPQRLRGTFVNPDHLALYLGLLLPLVFAFGWRYLKRSWSWEIKVAVSGILALLWLTLFAALAFTGSRGGLLAAMITLGAQGVVLMLQQRKKRWMAGSFLAGGAGLLFVAWIGLAEGFGRLFSTSAYEITFNVRIQVIRASAALFGDHPWFGFGLDGFGRAFEAIQPINLKGTWHHAHCDWLELLLATGGVGAFFFLLAIVIVVRRLSRILWNSSHPDHQALALGTLGVLLSAGLHECLDFGLTMPANAFTLAVICGLAYGLNINQKGHRVKKRTKRHQSNLTHGTSSPNRST